MFAVGFRTLGPGDPTWSCKLTHFDSGIRLLVRSLNALVLTFLALMIGRVAPVRASTVRTERPVSFDSQGTVSELTPALRRQLTLFPEIAGFERARLYCGDDSTFTLQIDYRDAGQEVRQLWAMTPAGVDSLRQLLDRHLATGRTRVGFDHAGRGELIFDSIVLSLVVYGPSAPVLLDVSGSRPSLATYMLTSAAGFYMPYRLTRYTDVTPTHRQLTQYGATRGIAWAFLLRHITMGGGGGPRSAYGFIDATSIGAACAGFRAVTWRGYSSGQAETVGVMGDVGLLNGLGVAWITGLYDEDHARRGGDAMVLTSTAAGLWMGDYLGRRQPYTRGDALVLRAGGFAGVVAALPLVNATGTSSDRAHVAAALAGQVGGIALTDRLLRERDFSFSEGLIVSGGELAGALLALGLTYLADLDGDFDELAYLTSAAAGSVGGLALTFHLFTPR